MFRLVRCGNVAQKRDGSEPVHGSLQVNSRLFADVPIQMAPNRCQGAVSFLDSRWFPAQRAGVLDVLSRTVAEYGLNDGDALGVQDVTLHKGTALSGTKFTPY